MPNYEYECLSCGHDFEIFQMMSDKPRKFCPKCRKPVRRIIGTGSGIIFKGAGFYATDYRKGKTEQASQEKRDEKACSQDKKPQDKISQDKKSDEKAPSGDKHRKSR